ncbi:MAG: ferrous iron transport protein B [Lentisphaerae bacterium]|jgi:ferrous iron transport protein B|nr:ferrous iron transport protein B [Lentisphaerota bacterium]MBT4823057.1 ferrous iron transport protein B [Lentisphaerota bacterium]MBT5610580.1 ferrous iron transport protein B [Lentisphaerota bacterium]MBT7060174.1 ferrous iron transport protein B [Lentisphaerota bacterium]MBT7844139.1 ferrous iron transport protein B [Lentisphaerota bacterium]
MLEDPNNEEGSEGAERALVVALAGNPNSGKTTLFNNLTGTRQHVGNYPGVTVEKKEGTCRYGEADMGLVDLPGTYSLTAYSVEERVSRNFLIDEQPDVVVDVLDASNLERNLYLAVQLIELGTPVVFALNMSDIAEAQGIRFDLAELSRFLGGPVVQTVGYKAGGMDELLAAITQVADHPAAFTRPHVDFGREIEEEIRKIEGRLTSASGLPSHVTPRWLAVKLLEGDPEVGEQMASTGVADVVAQSVAHLRGIFGDPPETVIPDRRYGFISGACQEAVRSTVEDRHKQSDRIDAIMLSRVFGLPIFLGLMYVVFQVTFAVGAVPMGWIESWVAWLAGAVGGLWPAGSESPLQSLLVDGVIGGVGGVLVFLPIIMLLFLGVALLEDSGYMARAAFIMDRMMHRIGLHGKSFIPMLIGFGCSVPGILATRTLESRRDRLTTIMITPLMSCGARLPIYALIIPAFFPEAWHGPMLWLIYVIGILLAIAAAKILRIAVLKGETTPFVMELPPYRMPTIKGAAIHTWERSREYLKKAGTIILGFSIILWAITKYPRKTEYDTDYGRLAAEAQAVYLTGARRLHREAVSPVPFEQFLSHAEGNPDATAHDAIMVAPVSLSEFVHRIRMIRARCEDTIVQKGLEDEELLVLALRHQVDEELARLRSDDPGTFDAALEFVDEAVTPYRERLDEIAARRCSEDMRYAVAGRIGCALEPILKPIGFDWRIGTALIGAMAAKEIFVTQMAIVFSVSRGEEDQEALRHKLQELYSPLVGFGIMLFCLVSAPCVATIACTWKETKSWRWAMGQWAGLTVLAYLVTGLSYWLGRILDIGV